ncbi:AraC family transcriptional regulator [Rhodopirellula sp. JC639]|uniref:AraC family transcriptional regulator n=1 Tax=Stieleria mannarensis TaxID=2755585 RepID=UPI001602C903|nr:AraC family transcriptional regulator [Rhodopirellula sp. JC639]
MADGTIPTTPQTPTRNAFSYLPVSDAAISLGFYLTGAGMDEVAPNASYPQQHHPELYDFKWEQGRVLPEFQFVYVHQGRGEFESDEHGHAEVESGTMILLFPGVWHRYRPMKETGWTEYWISIGGEMLFSLQNRGFLAPTRPILRLSRSEKVVDQYKKIIDFVTRHPDQQPASLCAKALTITAEVLDDTEHFGMTPDALDDQVDPVTRKALLTIWNHSHRKLSVAMIAKQIGVTTRTLERHFRTTTGQSVLEHITGCRLDRARRMLRETNLPIKYIAYAAGFSSLSHMCRVFQRKESRTPSDYRAENHDRAD